VLLCAAQKCRRIIQAKLELINPVSSVKNCSTKYMVEKVEKEESLKTGDTIVENSSGNTAIGFAMVAIQKGYQCYQSEKNQSDSIFRH